eukprot:TRINITY_DN1299_c0_g1_i2.p1 TRINITY_DN1299_c0_g1~~TRINITY_DN1299_c0_g1_i2.p1  ORF type:complete len:264 (-),score=13.76 TRINITY_DN1299_c0_g1_i2:358-1116(-)
MLRSFSKLRKYPYSALPSINLRYQTNNSKNSKELTNEQTEIINKIKMGLWIRRTSIFWGFAQYWANAIGWLQQTFMTQGTEEKIKNAYEKSFDLQDFLEGAKHAHEGVIQMFNDRDWENFQEVTSQPFFHRCQSVQTKFNNAGLYFKMSQEQQKSVDFYGILPGPVRQVQQHKDWLVLGVGIKYICGMEIKTGDDEVVFKDKEFQWDILIFGKGPLHQGNQLPADDLDLPWVLLDAMFFPARLEAIPNTLPK